MKELNLKGGESNFPSASFTSQSQNPFSEAETLASQGKFDQALENLAPLRKDSLNARLLAQKIEGQAQCFFGLKSLELLQALTPKLAPEQISESLKTLNASLQQGKKLREAFALLPEKDSRLLRDQLGEAGLQKLFSISENSRAQAFWQDALHWGTTLKLDQEFERAGGVLSWVSSQAGDADLKEKAKLELGAILGQGSAGLRGEVLISKFSHDAMDYRTILPMVGGTVAFNLIRTATLGRLAMPLAKTWYSAQWGARAIAGMAGFTGELLTFSLGSRALNQLSGEKISWDAESVAKDLASAGLTLGALKIFGLLGNQAFLKVHGLNELGVATRLQGFTKLSHALIPQVSMFGGMMAAHSLEAKWGLRKEVDDATLVTDTLGSMVSLGVGGALGHSVLGSKMAKFTQEMEIRTNVLTKYGDQAAAAEAKGPKKIGALAVVDNPFFFPMWMAMGMGGIGGGGGGKGSAEPLGESGKGEARMDRESGVHSVSPVSGGSEPVTFKFHDNGSRFEISWAKSQAETHGEKRAKDLLDAVLDIIYMGEEDGRPLLGPLAEKLRKDKSLKRSLLGMGYQVKLHFNPESRELLGLQVQEGEKVLVSPMGTLKPSSEEDTLSKDGLPEALVIEPPSVLPLAEMPGHALADAPAEVKPVEAESEAASLLSGEDWSAFEVRRQALWQKVQGAFSNPDVRRSSYHLISNLGRAAKHKLRLEDVDSILQRIGERIDQKEDYLDEAWKRWDEIAPRKSSRRSQKQAVADIGTESPVSAEISVPAIETRAAEELEPPSLVFSEPPPAPLAPSSPLDAATTSTPEVAPPAKHFSPDDVGNSSPIPARPISSRPEAEEAKFQYERAISLQVFRLSQGGEAWRTVHEKAKECLTVLRTQSSVDRPEIELAAKILFEILRDRLKDASPATLSSNLEGFAAVLRGEEDLVAFEARRTGIRKVDWQQVVAASERAQADNGNEEKASSKSPSQTPRIVPSPPPNSKMKGLDLQMQRFLFISKEKPLWSEVYFKVKRIADHIQAMKDSEAVQEHSWYLQEKLTSLFEAIEENPRVNPPKVLKVFNAFEAALKGEGSWEEVDAIDWMPSSLPAESPQVKQNPTTLVSGEEPAEPVSKGAALPSPASLPVESGLSDLTWTAVQGKIEDMRARKLPEFLQGSALSRANELLDTLIKNRKIIPPVQADLVLRVLLRNLETGKSIFGSVTSLIDGLLPHKALLRTLNHLPGRGAEWKAVADRANEVFNGFFYPHELGNELKERSIRALTKILGELPTSTPEKIWAELSPEAFHAKVHESQETRQAPYVSQPTQGRATERIVDWFRDIEPLLHQVQNRLKSPALGRYHSLLKATDRLRSAIMNTKERSGLDLGNYQVHWAQSLLNVLDQAIMAERFREKQDPVSSVIQIHADLLTVTKGEKYAYNFLEEAGWAGLIPLLERVENPTPIEPILPPEDPAPEAKTTQSFVGELYSQISMSRYLGFPQSYVFKAPLSPQFKPMTSAVLETPLWLVKGESEGSSFVQIPLDLHPEFKNLVLAPEVKQGRFLGATVFGGSPLNRVLARKISNTPDPSPVQGSEEGSLDPDLARLGDAGATKQNPSQEEAVKVAEPAPSLLESIVPPRPAQVQPEVTVKPSEGERAGLLGLGSMLRVFTVPLGITDGSKDFQVNLFLPNLHRLAAKVRVNSKGEIESVLGEGSIFHFPSPKARPVKVEKVENFNGKIQFHWEGIEEPLALLLSPVRNRSNNIDRLELGLNQPIFSKPLNPFFRDRAPVAGLVEVLHSEMLAFATSKGNGPVRQRLGLYLSNGDWVELNLEVKCHGQGSYRINNAYLHRMGGDPENPIVLDAPKDSGKGGKQHILLRSKEAYFQIEFDADIPTGSSSTVTSIEGAKLTEIPLPVWIRGDLPKIEEPEATSADAQGVRGTPAQAEDAISPAEALKRKVLPLTSEILAGSSLAAVELGVLANHHPEAVKEILDLYDLVSAPNAKPEDFGGTDPKLIQKHLLKEIGHLGKENREALDYLKALAELEYPEAVQELLKIAKCDCTHSSQTIAYLAERAESTNREKAEQLLSIEMEAILPEARTHARGLLETLGVEAHLSGLLSLAVGEYSGKEWANKEILALANRKKQAVEFLIDQYLSSPNTTAREAIQNVLREARAEYGADWGKDPEILEILGKDFGNDWAKGLLEAQSNRTAPASAKDPRAKGPKEKAEASPTLKEARRIIDAGLKGSDDEILARQVFNNLSLLSNPLTQEELLKLGEQYLPALRGAFRARDNRRIHPLLDVFQFLVSRLEGDKQFELRQNLKPIAEIVFYDSKERVELNELIAGKTLPEPGQKLLVVDMPPEWLKLAPQQVIMKIFAMINLLPQNSTVEGKVKLTHEIEDQIGELDRKTRHDMAALIFQAIDKALGDYRNTPAIEKTSKGLARVREVQIQAGLLGMLIPYLNSSTSGPYTKIVKEVYRILNG